MKTSLIGRTPAFIASGCFIVALVVATVQAWEPEECSPPNNWLQGFRGCASNAPLNARSANERMAMTQCTSRIILVNEKCTSVQVNNPDVVEVHPLSPTQLQVYAKRAGVTQIQ